MTTRTVPGDVVSRHGRRSRARGAEAPDPARYVERRPPIVAGPLCWFALGPADRALVDPGVEVAAGEPIAERAREAVATDLPPSAPASLQPGDAVDRDLLASLASRRGRRRFRGIEQATVLYRGTDGRVRAALGRSPEPFASVLDGTVETIGPGAVGIRAAGDGIPAAVAWGQPVRGPLLFAVSGPDAELRASAIDVAATGSIVVGGARVDIEALTRARALGVRGIICGGLIGKDLRQMEAAEERQRASIHPVAPFGVLLLDGYGRRPIPGPWWDALAHATGHAVSIVTDPPMVILDPGTARPAPGGAVRITAGEDLGREGRLLDVRGLVRAPGGTYLPSGLVALHGRAPSDPAERRIVPLTDLERLD